MRLPKLFRRFGNLEREVSTENPDPKPSTATPDDGAPAADSVEGQLAAMTAERDKLAIEKAEAEDRLRRAWAEFENARKRAERDRSEFVQFAAWDVVKSLLPTQWVEKIRRARRKAIAVQTA